MATLLRSVAVEDPVTHSVVVLVQGSVLPDWAAGLVTNPAVLGHDDHDSSESPQGADTSVDAATNTAPADDGAETTPNVSAPDGRASRETWADYARGLGIDVLDAWNRDQIKQAVRQADS